jgi:hypothetical protein
MIVFPSACIVFLAAATAHTTLWHTVSLCGSGRPPLSCGGLASSWTAQLTRETPLWTRAGHSSAAGRTAPQLPALGPHRSGQHSSWPHSPCSESPQAVDAQWVCSHCTIPPPTPPSNQQPSGSTPATQSTHCIQVPPTWIAPTRLCRTLSILLKSGCYSSHYCLSYYIIPSYSLHIHKTSVLSLCGLGPQVE